MELGVKKVKGFLLKLIMTAIISILMQWVTFMFIHILHDLCALNVAYNIKSVLTQFTFYKQDCVNVIKPAKDLLAPPDG